jgi:hypothetical protein
MITWKNLKQKISWHCPFNENFRQEAVEQEEQVMETEEEKVEKAALFLLETPANQMYVTGGQDRESKEVE